MENELYLEIERIKKLKAQESKASPVKLKDSIEEIKEKK